MGTAVWATSVRNSRTKVNSPSSSVSPWARASVCEFAPDEGSTQGVAGSGQGRDASFMEDQFEVRGDWWLPERSDRAVQGILRFSLDRGSELELFESLRDLAEIGERTEDEVIQVDMTEEALTRRYPRLLGVANGEPYTLIDCFTTNLSWRMAGLEGSERIHANRILRGKLFGQGESLDATGISIGLTYLNSWILETGIKEQWNWREDGQPLDEATPKFRLEAFEKPDQQVTTDDRRVISLKHGVGIDGNVIDRRSLTQSFHWRIDSSGDRADIDDLLDWASDLQDLVSICTQRTAGFEFVRFWRPDAYREAADGQVLPIGIDMFAEWNVKPDRPPADVQKNDLLFTFEDFGGIDGIRRWMNTAHVSNRETRGRLCFGVGGHGGVALGVMWRRGVVRLCRAADCRGYGPGPGSLAGRRRARPRGVQGRKGSRSAPAGAAPPLRAHSCR